MENIIYKNPDEFFPLAIPIIIDDVKRYRAFEMTRCTFFTIECDVPSPDWHLGLEGKSIPFFLIGISGVIFKPIGDSIIFESRESIDELFDAIEDNPSLYVDTNDLWLPNSLFKGPHGRGQVYRVDNKLFNEAYLYREERISEEHFLLSCRELEAGVRYSGIETRSFKGWGEFHIERARKDVYPKNRELVLKWR